MLVQRPAVFARPVTTAHLAQTMSLLELTSAELRQRVESELANNPALELLEENHCPTCGRLLRGAAPCPACCNALSATAENPLVYCSHREEFYTSPGHGSTDEEMSSEEYTAETPSLAEFVLRQVAAELPRSEQLIAAHILNSLDEDGLLQTPIVEIARYHHVSLGVVKKVFGLIQHAEPLGVGSPTSQEAMLIQLEALAENHLVPQFAHEAVARGMDLLSHRKYSELAHLLDISLKQSKEIARFVANNLNPFPARAFWGETASQNNSHRAGEGVYYTPDIIISTLHNGSAGSHAEPALVVEIALPFMGTLRINPLFRKALQEAPADKKESWLKDKEQAILLMKCIQQRNHTLVRMMRLLTTLQREFILKGDECLSPLTRASIAEMLELHESTISRAVTDKAVQLPNGHITPLARFFDRSLHIRSALKSIIEHETRPLSDSAIARLLEKEGHVVARRTVAKYRMMEGILPAHLRRANAA